MRRVADLVRGRTNHSPQSEEQSSERLGDKTSPIDRPLVGRTREPTSRVRPPTRGGRYAGRAHRFPQSFGALLLRLGARIRPTASGRLLSVKKRRTSNGCRDARSCVRCRTILTTFHFDGDGRTMTESWTDARECLVGGRPSPLIPRRFALIQRGCVKSLSPNRK